MNLFQRTAVTILVMFSVLFLSLLLSIRWIVQRGFKTLDGSYARQSAKILNHSLNDALLRLRVLTTDWAIWDDACRFVEDRNQEFIDSNLVDNTFENAWLSAIVFLNKDGQVVHASGYDFEKHQPVEPSDALLAHITTRYARPRELEKPEAGLASLPEGHVLLAAAPILPSAGDGPAHGVVVFTSPLEEGFLQNPICSSFPDLYHITLDGTANLTGFAGKETLGEDFFLMEKSASEVQGLQIVRDIDGRPALALTFDSPRVMREQHKLVLRLLSAALISMGFFLGLASVVLIRRTIVRRLSKLTEAVQDATNSGKLLARIPEDGSDEIADLARSFNMMMKALSKAQEEISEHDEYLKILFNSLHVGMLVIDSEDHIILDANEHALCMLGRERSAVCGQLCQGLACPASAGKCPVSDLHIQVDLLETVLLRADKEPLPILKSVVPITRNGRRLHVESFIDISRQKTTELALRSRIQIETALAHISAEFIQASDETVDEGIEAALKRIGELIDADRAYVYQFSRTRTHMNNTFEWCRNGVESVRHQSQNINIEEYPWWASQMDLLKPVHIPDLDTIPENSAERSLLASQGVKSCLAVPMHRKNALLGFLGFDAVRAPRSWLPEDINLLNVLAGVIAGALIRRDYEHELRASGERYRAIFENSGAGGLLVDETGAVVLANQQFCAMTGTGEQELLGKSWLEIVDQSDRPLAAELVKQEGNDNDDRPLHTLRLITRRYRDLYARTAVRRMPESREWSISFVDITDRKEAEQALRRADRIKSEFLANVSHEIRSPLNSIIGYAELIADSRSPERAKEHAHIILKQSEDLLALVNNVLDNAKLDAGKMLLHYEPYSVQDLLADLEKSTIALIQNRPIEMSIHTDPDLPPSLIGDGQRLRQVLSSLLTNAVKFTERGAISLEVSRIDPARNLLRFAVADTGIGIPADKQDMLFSSYTQIDSGSTRRFSGTGLGLAIAQKLTKLMGGEIRLESEPGKGSKFWFDISQHPSDSTAACPKETEQTQSAPGAVGLVLLVEDSPVIQELVRMHLEGMGHKVVSVDNGKDAVAACGENSFDVILMDLQMPEMDGIETAERIRKSSGPNCGVPIIAVTAHLNNHVRERCLSAGMNGILAKPFHRRDLVRTMEQWTSPMPNEFGAERSESKHEMQAEKSAPVPLVYSQALYEFSGNRGLLQSVMDQFVNSLPAQIDRMRESAGKADASAIGFVAHKLCGGAGNLTAYPLARAAAELEEKCRAGGWDEIPGLIEAVSRECGRLGDFTRDMNRAVEV